jgi:hypothetical protein
LLWANTDAGMSTRTTTITRFDSDELRTVTS